MTKILRKASRRAEKRVGRHDLRGASYLLKSALEEAKRSLEYNEDDGGPITRLLVERGVQLTLALVEGEKIVLQRMKKRGATQEEIRRKANQLLISRVRFMSLYVDELILERGRALDDYVLPYYFRYERCRRGACNRDYVDRFSEQFRLFVQEQIDFLEGYFIVPTSRRGVFPRGQGMHYLIAAEQMSESMGIDLQMYSDFHSCTGLDLENLSEDLRDYNWSGSRDLFRNEREAVNDVSQELNLASSSLSSCPYDWSEFEMDGDER